MTSSPTDPDLDAMAQDEFDRAMTLSWRELARITPWGDVYEGFSPGGRAVQVERNYLWAEAPGGDVLCEVAVFANPVLYDYAGRRRGLIRRPR
jgi:hypothetical protein